MNDQPHKLPADLHTHTVLCKHAAGMPIDYLHAAQKKGLPALASTDHCPNPHKYDPSQRMSMEEFDAYKDGFSEKKQGSTHLLMGIEADYYSGCHLFLEEFLRTNPFDVVLGAIHYQNFWAKELSEKTLFDRDELRPVWQRYFKWIALLAQSKLFDVVAHFDLPKKNGRMPPEKDIREMVLPALDKISQAGLCLEINTSGLRDPVHEMYPSPQILQWANERAIPITFGSNAHHFSEVGFKFDEAVRMARATGYTEYAIFEQRQRRMIPL